VSTHPEVETPFNPWIKRRNAELFCNLAVAGRLQLDDLITHRYLWRDAPAAFKMLVEDRTQAMAVILERWNN
jgi:threonine dehydrogenase-like Zn-dependent dehydrogenase